MNDNINSRSKIWRHRVVPALLITIVTQLIFIYVNYGEFDMALHYTTGIEIFFTFLYFLSLFWIYPKISNIIHGPALERLKSIHTNTIEVVIVVCSVFLLTTIIKIIPLWALVEIINASYPGTNAKIDMGSVRRSLIIHAILGLFFYYFVERERIRKQIRAEHLEYARLQKEKFEAQLENLKDQVNPIFLFNSLELLDSIIHKSPETAVEYVEKLSFVYRFFLDHKEQLISLENEIDLVESYFFILKTRLKERIKFDLKIEDSFLKYQLPPGSLQTLIENSWNHLSFSEENPIQITVDNQQEKLIIKSNLRPYETFPSPDSTLQKLMSRYRFFTDDEIKLFQTESEFVIELPLLKVENYQSN